MYFKQSTNVKKYLVNIFIVHMREILDMSTNNYRYIVLYLKLTYAHDSELRNWYSKQEVICFQWKNSIPYLGTIRIPRIVGETPTSANTKVNENFVVVFQI